jgi:hypothetical protein
MIGTMIGIGAMTVACLAATSDLTPAERAELTRMIEERDHQFDASENLLKTRIGSEYSYNTNLRNADAHPTRESLVYAADLLALGRETDRPRALAVLGRVLDLQDRDPESKTFGVWPHLAEEPLGKGPYIDRNWADFLGVQLLRIWIDSRDALPPAMVSRLETGIRNAAEAIHVRDVGPGYTNIAVMSAYVSIVAGERLSDPVILARGLKRLDDLVEHTRKNRDSLTEYNSPTYTKVALEELARLRHHVQTAEARPKVEHLYHLAWAEIATHHHANSGQWAGPYSRAYSDLIGEGLRDFLDASTRGRLGRDRPRLRHQGIPMPCPEELWPWFDPIKTPRTVVKAFEAGDHPITGTTHLTPSFALGSVNRQDTWNQRRNLQAHFGTPERPGYVRFRLLHDGYDFASGQFWSAQDGGRVLAGVTMATDGGDKHPSLDRIKDGTIRASDLRVRFEIGGPAVETISITAGSSLKEAVRVDLGNGLVLHLHAPLARFDGQDGRLEVGRDKDRLTIDIVLMHGPERAVKLDAIEEFVLVVGVGLGDDDENARASRASLDRDEGVVRARWSGMDVSIPTKPAPRRKLIQTARGRG